MRKVEQNHRSIHSLRFFSINPRMRCPTPASFDQTIQTNIGSDHIWVAHWGLQTNLSSALWMPDLLESGTVMPGPLRSRTGVTQTDTFNCLNTSNQWYNWLFSEKRRHLCIWFLGSSVKNITSKIRKFFSSTTITRT